MTETTGFEPDPRDVLDLGDLGPRVHGPGLYRRKPALAEAIRYTGPESLEACRAFAGDGPQRMPALVIFEPDSADLWVTRHKAWVPLDPGDWIVRQPDGQGVYPVPAAVFGTLFEPPPL